MKIQTPGLNRVDDEEDDDDEQLRRLKEKQTDQPLLTSQYDEQENRVTSHDLHNSLPIPSSTTESSFDMLSSDSSSSNADDETARINELYANIGDRIDGKHRIKIKGDEIKIKGFPNRQRTKLVNATFFRDQNLSTAPTNEPDLTSFDFLNDYEDKA